MGDHEQSSLFVDDPNPSWMLVKLSASSTDRSTVVLVSGLMGGCLANILARRRKGGTVCGDVWNWTSSPPTSMLRAKSRSCYDNNNAASSLHLGAWLTSKTMPRIWRARALLPP